MKEIILIPHAYDIRWSRDFNRLLSSHLKTPFYPKEPPYMKGRSLNHVLHSKILPWLRSNSDNVEGVFYANLTQDFSPDVVRAGGIKKVWGFVHGSLFTDLEPGHSPKAFQTIERGIGEFCEKAFVASEMMDRVIPYPTMNVGLPLYGDPKEPNLQPRILWNHRLSEEKGYKRLYDLPEEIRKRVIMTCPKFMPHKMPEVRAVMPNVYTGLPDNEYLKMSSTCGYALSTSDYDNFGYGVLESVWTGKFAVVPGWESVAYREFLPDEMLYQNISEIPNKITYYDEHPDKRAAIVVKAQEKLNHLRSDRWIRQLLMIMGVAR